MHTTAAPGRGRLGRAPGGTRWPAGRARSRGASASTSATSSTAGPAARAVAGGLAQPGAPRRWSSAASSGAHSGTTRRLDARRRPRGPASDLPEPAGPVTSTPSETVVPSRPSTSPVVEAEVEQLGQLLAPGRAARAGRPRVGGGPSGVGRRRRRRPPATAGDRRCRGACGGVARACQPTTVSMVTSAAGVRLGGDHGEQGAGPGVPDACWPGCAGPPRPDAGAERAGSTSCGSSETLSPAVTTLPSSASRSISGETTATISAGPARVTDAGRAAAGPAATVTWPPSRRPRLPSSRSSA